MQTGDTRQRAMRWGAFALSVVGLACLGADANIHGGGASPTSAISAAPGRVVRLANGEPKLECGREPFMRPSVILEVDLERSTGPGNPVEAVKQLVDIELAPPPPYSYRVAYEAGAVQSVVGVVDGKQQFIASVERASTGWVATSLTFCGVLEGGGV